MSDHNTTGLAEYTPYAEMAAVPAARKPFLANVRIDHGPADLLARFFIAADAAYAAHGVDLHFASFEELELANAANHDSWKPLNPTFLLSSGLVTDDNAFAIVGANSKSEIVTSIACMLFDWPTTNFKSEAESMRFLYADPARMAPPLAACSITAHSARRITGRAGYGGASWLHPSARKRQLAAVQSRLMRAVALARWRIDLAFGISSLGLIGKGFSNKNGWNHIEPGVNFSNLDSCPPEAGLVWMTAEDIIEDITLFLREFQADGRDGGHLRSAENAASASNLQRQDQPRIAHRRSPA